MSLSHKLPNIVVIAAGGGNDIFSAIAYIKSHLYKYDFKKIALIGLLGFTPFHSNSSLDPINLNIESPIIVPTANMHRYLVFRKYIETKETLREIYANERLLPSIISDLCPEITTYLCVSPKYSAIEQAKNLTNHLNSLGFNLENTLLNVVDFGGDILTDGNQSSIISPDLDAYTLALVSNMDYKSILSVCFPGVDGELDADYLTECCSKCIIRNPIDKTLWHLYLTKIYDVIKDTRPGNTIPNMLKLLNPDTFINKVAINKSWYVNGEKLSLNKEMEINPYLQDYIYFFDIPNNNPYMSIFNKTNYDLKMVMDHIMSIYENQKIMTEMNNVVQSSDLHLQYLRKDINGMWTNKHIMLNTNQQVMLIDIIPTGIKHNMISKTEPLLLGYDKVYSENM